VGAGALILASLFVDSFRFIPDNASLLFDKGVSMAELSFAALGIAAAITLPIGLWLGHKHRGLFLALALSSFGRALPSITLIGFAILIFQRHLSLRGDCLVALTVIAIPPILANAFLAVEGVDRDVVEAARGMGMSELQILLRVELPLGLPLILAGLRIASVFVIATATIAGIVGGGGLGDIINNEQTYRDAGVLGASYCVAALALLTAGGLALLQRAAFRRMSSPA
jgi:osmoprotectant transport system permease protein